MSALKRLIWSRLGAAKGGTVTVDTTISTTSENPVQNKAIGSALSGITLALAGKENATVAETIDGAAPTITPVAGHAYECGGRTSLTISNPPATGAWSIVFTSGSTATTTMIPGTILGLESFAPDANTIYEINVLDNRAAVGSWAVSAS